jgi:hypothetical protein
MTTIEYNACSYQISFHYPMNNPRVTMAQIEYEGCQLGYGEATCSPNDQFTRKIGRKLALARAVRDMFKNKQRRIDFWKAVFEKHPEWK